METIRLFDAAMDTNFKSFALIKNADIRQDRNGKDYLALTFQDRSGILDGKLWGMTDADAEKFQVGRVVYLYGRRELFNGQPQFRIEQMRLADQHEPNDPLLYMPEGPMTKEEMQKEIEETLADFQLSEIQQVVRYILDEVGDDFYYYPAAKKHHHAFVGGLAYHTVSMLALAKAIQKLYPILNADLLYAGVILHDIAKTSELSDPLSGNYTVQGNLLGHISLVAEKLSLAIQALGLDQTSEELMLLKHMVLAHHGKKEYGSPVTPHVLEAEVLHRIDDLDASMYMVSAALEKTAPSEFSAYIPGMDGRPFYRPKLDQD